MRLLSAIKNGLSLLGRGRYCAVVARLLPGMRSVAKGLVGRLAAAADKCPLFYRHAPVGKQDSHMPADTQRATLDDFYDHLGFYRYKGFFHSCLFLSFLFTKQPMPSFCLFALSPAPMGRRGDAGETDGYNNRGRGKTPAPPIYKLPYYVSIRAILLLRRLLFHRCSLFLRERASQGQHKSLFLSISSLSSNLLRSVSPTHSKHSKLGLPMFQ